MATVEGEALVDLRESLVGIVRDPRARPRERVAAARVLVSAYRLLRESDRLRSELARRPASVPVPDDAPDSLVCVGEVW